MRGNSLSSNATKNGLFSAEFPAKSGILIQEVINTFGGRVFGGSFKVLIPAKVRGGVKEAGQERASKNGRCEANRERAI